MNVLLSIKPKYVEAIMRGDKRYEFRRSIFRKKIEKIFIYSTAPTKRIVGAFVIGKIIEDRPESLWSQLHGFSGMDADEFFSYFNGVEKGFAIQIDKLEKFENFLAPAMLFPRFVPPQSFCYICPIVFFP